MVGSAVPALVGVVLLLLLGILALVVEGRSAEGRWFALVNFFLAATSALGGVAATSPLEHAERALRYGKVAYGPAVLAFITLYMQLAALARDTPHPQVARLRRLTGAVVAISFVVGALCVQSSWIVSGVEWRSGAGYVPRFGAGLPILFATQLVTGAWALGMVVLVRRHGSPRRRSEAAWIGAGVLSFDWFGLTLLAVVLPRFGLPTVAWAPASLVAGLMVMLAGMVLTRQRELEALARPPSRPARASPVRGAPAGGCRACATCGAVLSRHVEMAHCPLDGGAMVLGADPWSGRTLAERFVIERLLGTGGMGRVYRARPVEPGAPVALKLLNAEFAADPHTVERFAREARSSMRIHSPHVVVVHDLGEAPPGLPFLTMELIEGASLGALLAGGRRLSAPSVALLGRQLAAGLAAAHAQGVIHRDLKPDNVLVAQARDGDTAKIVDFGLAKIVDEPAGQGDATTLGRVFGTPAYLSPEQAAGLTADARSDVYALGVVLYRARSGRKPFEGSVLELLASHISEVPLPLGAQPLDALVMSLLAKDPAERPDARALEAAFDRFAQGRRLQVDTRRRDPSLAVAVTTLAARDAHSDRAGRERRPTPSPAPPSPSGAAATREHRLPAAPETAAPETAAPETAAPAPAAPAPPGPARRPERGAMLRFADAELALATSGHALISVLRLPLTLDGIARMRRESRHLFGADQRKWVTLTVIEPTAAAAVSSEVRAASAHFAREFSHLGAAIVIEGSGFRPAATRTLIAGVYLVTKKGYPHKIFESPADGAAWLTALLAKKGLRQDAAELLAAVDEARRAIG